MTPVGFGRYQVVGELGHGAMGVVYRGLDPALDRPVAIKVISARVAASSTPVEELEARFLREAKISARLSHPGVVTVFDAGREGDSLYLVMELVEGESLAHRMMQRRYPAPDEALRLTAQVADALAAAHSLGIVHRDIKPANILLTRSGTVKVTDFGVAKAVGEGTDLTRTGTVVGSPAYMAPEQVRGAAVDGRTDLFSLGVVLYELLLHRKPFPADTLTTLIFQILNEDPLADPLPFRTLGDETAAFLRSCLAKDPAERTPDAAVFASQARALAGVLANRGVDITSPTAPVAIQETQIEGAPTAVMRAPAEARVADKPAFPVLPLVILAAGALMIVAVLAVFRRGAAPPAGGVLLAPTAVPAATVPTSVSTPPGVRASQVTPMRAAVATRAPVPTWSAQPTSLPVVGAFTPSRLEPVVAPTPPIEKVFICSKGAEFNVSPDDAEVAIDGKVIGIADDWDGKGGGRTYFFPHPGTYYARFTLKDYRTAWVKIIVQPGADDEIADIDTELQKAQQ